MAFRLDIYCIIYRSDFSAAFMSSLKSCRRSIRRSCFMTLSERSSDTMLGLLLGRIAVYQSVQMVKI